MRMALSLSVCRMETGLVVTNAKTRQGKHLYTPTQLFAHGYSCKHFCCREGLEKPPKPRKRAASNHKAGNFNQLTLSAAITKRGSLGEASKGKQPAKELPKLTTSKKPKDRSKSYVPKLPPKRRSSTRRENGNNGTAKQPASKTGEKESNTQAKTFSSDFGDDSLDDLPSLSDLIRGIESSTAPADQAVSEAHQRGDSVFDSPVTGAEPVGAADGPKEPQSLQTLHAREFIEISDDSSPEPGKNIFTNHGDIESSVATAPLSSSSGNIIRLPTRKTSRPCGTYEAKLPERAERSRSPKYLLPPLDLRHNLTHLQPLSAIDSISKDQVHRAPTNSSSGWDDVDRLLLEEFKDVINHY